MSTYKCYLCPECNGRACKGQMPGMGGSLESRNFILNCDGWKEEEKSMGLTAESLTAEEKAMLKTKVALAPMTGAIQNCGFPDEKQFYVDMVRGCLEAGVAVTLGDGAPDDKLLFGLDAVRMARETFADAKAHVFLKPYPNEKLFQRIEWAQDVACGFGVDIDAYNIITMRETAHLEKKTPELMKELKQKVNSLGLPLIIKGIFTKEDLELCKEVKPDVALVSNHGGRVETEIGSTVEFLKAHVDELKNSCGHIWVDGGIRTALDIKCALSLGADFTLIGRPFVTALARGSIPAYIDSLFLK